MAGISPGLLDQVTNEAAGKGKGKVRRDSRLPGDPVGEPAPDDRVLGNENFRAKGIQTPLPGPPCHAVDKEICKDLKPLAFVKIEQTNLPQVS